ncbi:Mercury resistance transport protein/cytochrome c biogenesis protein [Mycobacteroides abscessus]|nr:Mercury resistance transport protein/cytochrome c biogenesis protein [Mycobacteroides abscessus]
MVRGPGAEIGKSQALARAVIATVVMAGGFVAVFTVFGLLTVSVASVIQRYLPFVTVVFGIGLVILGLWLLAGRDIIALMPKVLDANAPTTRLGSMFGYGVGYAVASLSCTIGPFLAVTSTTFESGSLFDGVLVYLAYASGITLVVGTLAVSTALASTMLLKAMRRALPYLNRVSGAILIVVGAYVGYYGSYEAGCSTPMATPTIRSSTRPGRFSAPSPAGSICTARGRGCSSSGWWQSARRSGGAPTFRNRRVISPQGVASYA